MRQDLQTFKKILLVQFENTLILSVMNSKIVEFKKI